MRGGTIVKIFDIVLDAASAFIAGADSIYSEDADFDRIRGFKRKWKD